MLYKDRKSKVVLSCVTLALSWVISAGMATMGAHFLAAHLPMWVFIQVCDAGRELYTGELVPIQRAKLRPHRTEVGAGGSRWPV